MKRARAGVGAGLGLALALCGCGGGPPDDVPFVRTGGTQVIPKAIGGPITSGERLGNSLQPSVTSQSGTTPTAGTGNDLSGAAGFEAPADSDFIGVDEINSIDDFQDVEDFANINNFAAGFAVPGLGAVNNTGSSTTTTTGTTGTTGATGANTTTSTTTTTTTTRRTTNAQ